MYCMSNMFCHCQENPPTSSWSARQARHCNFGKALDDKLRDQLIEKLSDNEWEKRLLAVRNISLEDAMDKIWLWEQAHDQVTKMNL